MFNNIKYIIRNYFGFSKSETNGFIILLPLLILGLFTPQLFKQYLKSKTQSDDSFYEEEFRKWVAENEKHLVYKDTANVAPLTFDFDPNLATVEELMSLGFREKIAHRINNYRTKGGRFKSADDLRKIYGISQGRIEELSSHIKISGIPNKPEKTRNDSIKPVITKRSRPEASKININLASQEELVNVYGIGPVLSERILKYRNLLGGFHSWNQLSEVYGLRPEIIDKVKERFYIDEFTLIRIDLNQDSIKTLAKHPYISYSLAKVIVAFRNQHGDFQSVNDLNKIKIFNDSIFERVRPYLIVTGDMQIQ